MGLDATVYCDCYEKGRVRASPPQPELVFVDESGEICLEWDAPGADQWAFHAWRSNACEHGPSGQLIAHRLGNVALVAWLRQVLSVEAARFPILVEKVVYSGTHGGDRLGLQDVDDLDAELRQLASVHADREEYEAMLRDFEMQMLALVQAAKSVGKPISF